MTSTLKKKIKDILVYFVGSVLTEAVLFFLLPLYTKYLSPEEYGYFDLIKTYSTFIINFCFLQIHTVVLRYLFEKRKEEVISNSYFIALCSTIITALSVIIMSFIIDVEYIPLVILYSVFSALANYYAYIARGCGNNILFAASGLTATIVNVAINIILIIFCDFGYVSLYIAGIISYLIQCLIVEFRLRVIKNISLKEINKATLFDMLKFSIPYALNISAYWFLTSYSKTVISNELGNYYNGLYAVATKFTTILSILSTCLLMVWQETSFAKYEKIKSDKDQIGKYYTESNKIALCFIIYCAALLLPAIRVAFPILIDSSYNDALVIVPLSIIAMIINVYCSYLTSIFTAIKKNYGMLIASVIGAIVNIILANLFVSSLFIDGVNIAMIIGLLLNAIIRLIVLKKQINLKLKLSKCIIPALLVLSAYFIFIYLNIWWNIVFAMIVCLILFFDIKGIVINNKAV